MKLGGGGWNWVELGARVSKTFTKDSLATAFDFQQHFGHHLLY